MATSSLAGWIGILVAAFGFGSNFLIIKKVPNTVVCGNASNLFWYRLWWCWREYKDDLHPHTLYPFPMSTPITPSHTTSTEHSGVLAMGKNAVYQDVSLKQLSTYAPLHLVFAAAVCTEPHGSAQNKTLCQPTPLHYVVVPAHQPFFV